MNLSACTRLRSWAFLESLSSSISLFLVSRPRSPPVTGCHTGWASQPNGLPPGSMCVHPRVLLSPFFLRLRSLASRRRSESQYPIKYIEFRTHGFFFIWFFLATLALRPPMSKSSTALVPPLPRYSANSSYLEAIGDRQ